MYTYFYLYLSIYLVSLICTDESMTVTLNTEEPFQGKVIVLTRNLIN